MGQLLVLVIIGVAMVVGTATAGPYDGKRVLHIDSYHRGNTWNDRIADAVADTLQGTGAELKIIHMDTKRNATEAFKKQAALDAKAVIEAYQPHVVTASDDNAAKYLIMPYFKDADLPFVFCGLNWDAATYGFPFKNVTGMVEVSPIPQIISMMQRYAEGSRLGYIAEDTPTKRKELEYHERLFGIRYNKVYLVKTFEDWKASFLNAQDEVDMLIVLGVAAVTDWDDEAAGAFAESNTRIPTGTDFGWLMHVAFLGVGKVPEEQGRWAAQAALRILNGVPPSRIPLTTNKEGKLYFNRPIAAKLGVFDFPRLAEVVPE